MPAPPSPPRRFRFGLRSLFVLVTVEAALAACLSFVPTVALALIMVTFALLQIAAIVAE